MKLSIVIPCYNERENISILLEAFDKAIADVPIEVILVDNGSTDGSGGVIRKLVPKYGFVKTVRIEKNQGYGYGILQGLKVAEGDYLGWTHADLQTDPADIRKAYKIIRKYKSDNLFIKGLRGNRPAFDVVFTAGMGVFESFYFHEKLYDVNAQPNIFPRKFYAAWEKPPYDFSLELFAMIQARKQGLEVHRFKVEFPERIHGCSSWNTGFFSKFRMIQRTLSYSFELKHSERIDEMGKKKAVIFGTAGTGKKIYHKIEGKEEVVAFSDNDSAKWGGYSEEGIKIISPDEIINEEFDVLYIGSMVGLDEISKQMLDLGVPSIKINKDLPFIQVQSRILFLENFARLVYDRGLEGAVAEAGVYKGDYAKEINRMFPDRKLYLFDTFEGFPERDIKAEDKKSDVSADYLKQTSEDVVMKRMIYPENCIVKKGYFPETAGDIKARFVYVSLDMDLYQPTFAGIEYFYPKMVEGGVIAVHDYFSDAYPNIKQSLKDYEQKHHVILKTCPVGDDVSIAIVK